MRNLTITLAIITVLSWASPVAGAGRQVDQPGRILAGIQLGMARSAAFGNRIGGAGWGAAFRGEFGVRVHPSLYLPYVTAGATWGRGDVPEWELHGYADDPDNIGLLARQVSLGVLYRYRLGDPRVHVYGGPSFLYAWQEHVVRTWYEGLLDRTDGAGPGWLAVGGIEFAPSGGTAIGGQIMYERTYSTWEDLPDGADGDFTFQQFQIGGFFRFFL